MQVNKIVTEYKRIKSYAIIFIFKTNRILNIIQTTYLFVFYLFLFINNLFIYSLTSINHLLFNIFFSILLFYKILFNLIILIILK